MKKVFFITILILSFSSFSQSPWVREWKEKYVEFGLNTIPTYQKVFQGNQTKIKDIDGSILEIGTQLYIEYGLGKNFQIQGDLPLRYMSSAVANSNEIRTSGSIIGLGNIETGIKYRFLEVPFLFAGQVTIGLPNGGMQLSTGLRTGYDAFYFVPTISTGNGGDLWYYYIYGGVGVYTNQFSDDLRLGGEYGRMFFSKLWVVLTLSMRESLENGDYESLPSFEETHLYVNNQSYTSLALKLSYELNANVGLNCAVNLISLRANNLPFQRPFSVSIYKKG